MSMKNSTDNSGNRTRDLPTCSAVPQPTALPRAPLKTRGSQIFLKTLDATYLGTRRVAGSKSHTRDPQILGDTVHSSVVRATWRPGFVYPWLKECTYDAITWNMFRNKSSPTAIITTQAMFSSIRSITMSREEWRAVVNAVMNFRLPQNAGNL